MSSVKKFFEIKKISLYFVYLLTVWGFYRLLFILPEVQEGLILKPIIWLIPLFLMIRHDKDKQMALGIYFQNTKKTLILLISLCAVFIFVGFLGNFLKYSSITLSSNISSEVLAGLLLSIAVAITEEIVFRGYFLSKLVALTQREIASNIITTTGWVLIHLPAAVLDLRLSAENLIIYLILISLYSFGVGIVYLRTKNILAPIFLNVFWQLPIIIFR